MMVGEDEIGVSARDKPEGARLGWQLLETSYPFATPWLKLRQDRVRIAGRGDITYTYITGNAAVFVVPVTVDGQVVLIRQYRYTIDAWCLEVPAGGTHDRAGVALEDVAREELAEEVGGTCETMERVADFYPSTSRSAEACHVFLATGVTLGRPQALQETERIEIHPVPAREALAMARGGRIADGQSALALLLCEDALRGRGLC